jgi:two-component sensor histidine kinase
LLLIRDVTANKASEQTIRTLLHFLQDRDEDRTRLLSRSNAAIEAERNRIARDLHDGPIQGVSAAALSLEALRLMVQAGDTDRARETLQEIATELGQEAVALRRIMSDLRPPVLEERGLIPAVRELCSRVRRETGIDVQLTGSPSTAGSRDLEALAYRVVQEALSNVGKHSGAKHVTVRIEMAASTVEVSVADDGWGFDTGSAREFLRTGKVGLASMRERTELAGGSFSIRSTPGAGTVVTASIPFDPLATGSPMAELGESITGLSGASAPRDETLADFSGGLSGDDWDARSRNATRARPSNEDRAGLVVVPGGNAADPAFNHPASGEWTIAAGGMERRRRRRQPGASPGDADDDGVGDGEGLSDGVGENVGEGVGGVVGGGVSDGVGDVVGETEGEGDPVAAPRGMTS